MSEVINEVINYAERIAEALANALNEKEPYPIKQAWETLNEEQRKLLTNTVQQLIDEKVIAPGLKFFFEGMQKAIQGINEVINKMPESLKNWAEEKDE